MDLNPASNRALLGLLLAAAGLYLLWLLSPILTPFLLAAAIAYVCDPLVDRLEAKKLPRGLGTALVMLGLVLLFAILVLILTPLVQAQARLLVAQVPVLLEWAQQSLVPWIRDTLGVDLVQDQAELLAWARAHVSELSGLTAYLPNLKDSGLAVLGFVANLLLVPVVTFYLMRDWDRVMANLADWLPSGIQSRATTIAGEIDIVLSEFLRGQLAVILIMAVFYSLGLWLVGLDYALAVGLVSGVLVFVPYLGVIVGVLLGTLAGLAQFGELSALIQIWAVFAVGQLIEGMAVTPWLVGERVGLHPVAVIFALMAFGQLFGFFGVLLALPASAALLVGLRELRDHYFASELYSREPEQ
jgi:predicted PurR-regulated permease PerM